MTAGRTAGLKHHAYRTFCDNFRTSAALAVKSRLHPEDLVVNITDEDREAARDYMARCDQREKAKLKKMTRSQRRKLKEKEAFERNARSLGVACGMEVEIGTNAVGDRGGKTSAIEHQC